MLQALNPPTPDTRDDRFVRLLFAAGLASNSDRLAQEVIRVLRLPDSATSRGLKKCHESFDSVCATLDKVFTQTREESVRGSRVASDHLAAAILLVYARMGQDNILRRRIVFETSFLQNTVALLNSPFARNGVVFTLSKITHQCDKEVRQAIARFTSDMLDSAEPNLDDVTFVEKTVCVLSHTATSIFWEGTTPDPEVVAALPRVLRFMLSVVRLPGSTHLSFIHLVTFCQQTASRCPKPFLANPDCLDFLVACSRARDICTRICSQRALIDVFRSAELGYECEREPRHEGTRGSLEKYYRGTEPYISNIQKDQYRFIALIEEYESNPDCSHVDLGKEIAAVILSCEAVVRAWIERDVRDGEPAKLPKTDETNELDVTADVLRIILLVSKGDRYEASYYAREALKRHPSVPFFYYIIAHRGCGIGDDTITRVLYAEKGLRLGANSDGMTEFIRLSLLYFTIHFSHTVVSSIAEGASVDSRMKELNALTKTALGNSNTFARIAPLDHWRRPLMAAVGTFIDLARNGHLWADDSFQTSREVFAHICDIARCTSAGFQPTEECLALEKILDRIFIAWDTWGSTVSRQASKAYTSDPAGSDVDIVVWFEQLNADPCFLRRFHLHGIDPGTQKTGHWAQLHTCSFCNNANATLKQCAGCQKTRYCNNVCQKKHWKMHREACKAST
ncbi:hypothetical protein FB45DRAFT_1033794 [Roridomyces roridus]|uniref:MYND-type domain-containing protein n=1 Tax=Roridomyces roridus TaxID=1738132 RepID=A0AAD7BEA2_9AGAR|nr:hypothetical protein FB45DRAFT_1033794 [Roridomyces roridus]